MSYSRWGDSVWYTYWTCGPDDEDRDTATLVVSTASESAWLTAKDIRDNIADCLRRVQEINIGVNLTAADMHELAGYMIEFLDDVDEEYSEQIPESEMVQPEAPSINTIEEFMALPEGEQCVCITAYFMADICKRIQALEAKP